MDKETNSRGPSRPDKAEERRQQIMEAALTCFSRKGFHRTTMDDIVAESGLSKGTLYWYFEGKDDLFMSLVKSFFLEMGSEFEAILEQPGSASDKLRAIARGFTEMFLGTEEFFNVFLEFWIQSALNEKFNQLIVGVLVQYRRLLVEIIAEGVKAGEFEAVDSTQLALATMAVYDGLAFYAMLMPDQVDMDQAGQAFVEVLIRGLTARGRPVFEQQIGTSQQ